MLIFNTLLVFALVCVLIFVSILYFHSLSEHELNPPELKNNPSWDVIMTELTPLLSFTNAKGGSKKRHYEVEIDTSKNFNSANKIIFSGVAEGDEFVTEVKISEEKQLKDKTQYWWRARTLGSTGAKSDWAISRFFVDIASDDHFMNLVRAKVKNVEVSAGYNSKNIVDYDDPGLVTFWQSPPPEGYDHWVKFDLGESTTISRIWILSNPTDADGWLKDFVLEASDDGKKWREIPETRRKNNDTFRNIIDFPPTRARYYRLKIYEFIGYAAQINEVILYSPGTPPVPKAPEEDYILIIGNEHNGFTFTDLAKFIEEIKPGLKTITVPYFEASLEMIKKLKTKPLAIILSGNNADYPNLPMFEHNGEFEIIRESDIPILGICAGHQFLAMAYGYSRARSMGWSDISAIAPEARRTKIKVLQGDPIFAGMPDEFVAPEIHGWAVAEPAGEFEVIAKSTYVQAQKSKKRLIYGAQFHFEIKVSYNQAALFVENFLKLAAGEKK